MATKAPGAAPALLFLTEDDIRGIGITMKDVINVVEEVFRQHGNGAVEMAQRAGIYPLPESFTQALVAHVPAVSAAGAKIVSVFPSNRGTEVPVTTALLVLTGADTGAPLAVMDATWITEMRTGAVTAVAAMYLASPDAREVAIIGAGVQGRGNLTALATAFPDLEEVRVHDISPEAAGGLVDEMQTTIPVKMRNVGSAQEAVEGADVVVTATAVFKERNALVKRDWVKPGALLTPLEVDTALDASLVYEPDLLIVDDIEQTLAFQKMGCFTEGKPTIHAELGEIVAGMKKGRKDETEIVVSMNVGLSIEDIAVGQYIYQRANEQEVGQRLAVS